MKLINAGTGRNFGAALALLSLSACQWVDSAGSHDSTGNLSEALPSFIDSSVVVLDEGDSFSINENTQRTVAFSSSDSRLANWSWKLLDGQANIRNCQQFDDFEIHSASNTLRQSCATTGDCEIKLEEQIIDNLTHFSVTTPLMRAPAALEYQFTALNQAGESIVRRQFICAIPINEAPDAVDDLITMTRGTSLLVSGEDDQSLLANDADDEDIRNQALRVNTTAVAGPTFAAQFELFSDGGFVYEPRLDAPLSRNGSISDSFIYSVTDGSNTNTARVSIQITDVNTAPMLISVLPEIEATITERDEDLTFFNLRFYFSDAEFDSLTFNALEGSLPESGNVFLTSEGELKGNPLDSDSGRYFVSVTASDSVDSTETSFYLNIVRGSGDNTPPYANDITNTTVQNQFNYDVSGFFGDRDQDHLTFTASELPAGVELSPDGVIFGTSTTENRGLSFIRVFANDGNGGTTSDGFLLRIR